MLATPEDLHPFPTGWYALGFSTELAPGEVKTVRYLGQDIVLFRTEGGEAVATRPYGPHQAFVEDFAKDFPIWENKAYVPRPRLSAADGPVGVYRRWTRQFYADGERRAGRGAPVCLGPGQAGRQHPDGDEDEAALPGRGLTPRRTETPVRRPTPPG